MFAVIYEFQVKPGQEKIFEDSWTALTELILKHEGSEGSCLHHVKDQHYLAYARWPTRKRWEDFGDGLPPIAKEYSKKMKEACSSSFTAHELNVCQDLLALNK